MTEESYYATACTNEDCLETVRVSGGREEAIRAAEAGCPQCYSDAVPMFFEPMGKPVVKLDDGPKPCGRCGHVHLPGTACIMEDK